MTTHRVYFGKGDQTVRTIPHRDKRPVRVESGTYAIYDARFGDVSSDHIVVAAGTAAAISSVSTVLTAKAGRNANDRHAVTVSATAGITAGRTFLLTSPVGHAQTITVASVVSGTALLAANEIRGDFPTGSTLQGVEVSATFPAVEADDDDNLDGLPYVVVWDFPGFPPLRDSIFLQRAEESLAASLDDLLELDSSISNVGGDRRVAETALARAHKDLRTEMLMAGANESDMLLGPIGRDAVLNRAAVYCWMNSSDEQAKAKVAFYDARWTKLVGSLKLGSEKPQVVTLSQASAEKVAQKAAAFVSF